MRKTTLMMIFFVASFSMGMNAQAGFVTGTGFFITSNGYLVTAYHVIGDARTITVKDGGGATHAATVVAADTHNDLIILKVDGVFDALPIAPSNSVRPGTKVITMGFPHVDIQGGEPKVTEGIISSSSGIDNDPTVFQISVQVQSGNSGGPLVTMEGSVVGIINSKLNSVSMLKSTGDLPQNVNYAVKSNYLIELASTQNAIQEHLLTPSKKHNNSTVQVADAVAKAIVLVITEVPNNTEKKEEPTQATKLPTSWLSMRSGSIYTVSLIDDRILFLLSKPGLGSCNVSVRGEAKKYGNLYSGTEYLTMACAPSWRACSFTSEITFGRVTPNRIEGVIMTAVTNFDSSSCQINSSEPTPFVWIPN